MRNPGSSGERNLMEEQRSPGRGSQFFHYSSVMALKCGIGMGLGNRRLSAPAQGGGLFFSLQQGLRLSLDGGTEPPPPAYLPASLPLPLLSRPPAHSDWLPLSSPVCTRLWAGAIHSWASLTPPYKLGVDFYIPILQMKKLNKNIIK